MRRLGYVLPCSGQSNDNPVLSQQSTMLPQVHLKHINLNPCVCVGPVLLPIARFLYFSPPFSISFLCVDGD